MENSTALIISIVSTIISTIGALIAIYRVKPEVRKINTETKKLLADEQSAIGNAAESIAEGANVTVGMLNSAVKRLMDQMQEERAASKKKIGELEESLKQESLARIKLGSELQIEKQARLRAEQQMISLRKYIEDLQSLMKKADIIPPPPPFHWLEDDVR